MPAETESAERGKGERHADSDYRDYRPELPAQLLARDLAENPTARRRITDSRIWANWPDSAIVPGPADGYV